MGRAIAVLGVVLCVSLLEGLWAWLLTAAVSEVAGQGHPLYVFVGLILFAGWLTARMLILNNVSIDRQRWILIGGGLALSLIAGTVQSGLLLPIQLLFGSYTPDFRGAGILLVLLIAYLWGRGMALATEVNRDRVVNHIAVAAAALIAVLVFLPLTDAVQSLGLGSVVVSFAIAIAALLLVQAMGVEAHELTPTRWGLIASGFVITLLLAGAVLTGALSSGFLIAIGGALRAWGQIMQPVTNAVLLALGHLAQLIADILVAIGEFFGADAATVIQNMRAAEQARPEFEREIAEDAPGLLTGVVAVFCTLFFGSIAVLILHRLVDRYMGRDSHEIQEARSRARGPRRGGLLDLLGHLRRQSSADGDLDTRDPRQAIRLHYRRFELMLARAGLPRRAGETPREYGSAVARALPLVQTEAEAIANAYSLARYSEPGRSMPSVEPIEQAVQRVRTTLASLPGRPERGPTAESTPSPPPASR